MHGEDGEQAAVGMRRVAAIALGSNLDSGFGASGFGSREANLREAVRRVGALGAVTAVSSFRETDPVGYLDQPKFLNGAMLLETELEPEELLAGLLAIERGMGRDRTDAVQKGPRLIDLDLLLVGDEVVRTETLELPHPAMTERRFVLEPLAEIAAGMVHPVAGVSVGELLERL